MSEHDRTSLELVDGYPTDDGAIRAAGDRARRHLLTIYREHDATGSLAGPTGHRVAVLTCEAGDRLRAEPGDELGRDVWAAAVIASLADYREDRHGR